MQEVGLSSSRTAAAYVHTSDGALARHHNSRPGQPAVAIGGVVADLKPLDHPLILPTCQIPVALEVNQVLTTRWPAGRG
jgi:hypothetical protein